MTVESAYPIQSFPGDASTATFSVTIDFRRPEDLLVQTVAMDGTRVKLILGTDYTLAGTTLTLRNPAGLTASMRLEVRRVVAISQDTSIQNQGEFYADIHEDAFDKLTQIDQQQEHDLESAVKIVNEDGTPAGGTLTKRNDSILAINGDGNIELIEHDPAVVNAERVDANTRNITGLRSDLGNKADDITDNPPPDTAFSRIKANQRGLAANDEKLRTVGDALGDRGINTVTGDHNPPAFNQIRTLKGEGISVFTLRLYYITDNEVDLVNFTVKPVAAFSIAPSLFGTGGLQFQQEPNREGGSPAEVFNYYPVSVLRQRLQEGKHLQAIDVEFHAHKITDGNYATHNLPANFAGGIRGIPFNWSPVSIRVTDQDFHGGGGPSVTFIRETVVNPAINIHNQDEGAHDAIQMRLEALEAGGGGGGGGGNSAKGLQVLAVNDGLPVFDSSDAVPNMVRLKVQTDVSIHGPITVRLPGGAIRITPTIGTRGDTAISSGNTETLTFALTSENRDSLHTSANTNNGVAEFEIWGALSSGGTATRQAFFELFFKESLATMIGPNNRNEIMTQGLPGFLPNIITTVLANMKKGHRDSLLLGDNTSPAGVATTTPIPANLFQDWLDADSVTIAWGTATGAALDTARITELPGHFIKPDGSLGELSSSKVMLPSRAGSIDVTFNKDTRAFTAVAAVGGENVRNYAAILYMIAHVPTYSFAPGMTYAHLTSGSRGAGGAGESYISSNTRTPDFTHRPGRGEFWMHTFVSGLSNDVNYQDSPNIQVLRFNDSAFRYGLFAWMAIRAGTYTVRVTQATGLNASGTLRKYVSGGATTTVGTVRFNTTGEIANVTLAVGDVVAIVVGSLTTNTRIVGLRVEVGGATSLPGYTAP